MNLITGRTGTDHVLARHDAIIHRTLLGNGDYVLQYKDNMSWSPVEGRELAINPGALIMQGRLCEITAQEVVPVNVCSAENLKKIVYICAEYTIDDHGIENVRLMTIEGREASNTEIEPEVPYEDGVIDDGETHQMVLYAVHVEGFIINHSKVEQKFTLLETEPIQTALDYAKSNIKRIEKLVDGMTSAIRGQWKNAVDVYTTSTYNGEVKVDMGNSYEGSIFDIIDVYLNGFRATSDDATAKPFEIEKSIDVDGGRTVTYTISQTLELSTGDILEVTIYNQAVGNLVASFVVGTPETKTVNNPSTSDSSDFKILYDGSRIVEVRSMGAFYVTKLTIAWRKPHFILVSFTKSFIGRIEVVATKFKEE